MDKRKKKYKRKQNTKNDSSKHSASSFSSQYFLFKNNEIHQYFEENIRNKIKK